MNSLALEQLNDERPIDGQLIGMHFTHVPPDLLSAKTLITTTQTVFPCSDVNRATFWRPDVPTESSLATVMFARGHETGMRWVGTKKKNMDQSRSFQLGDHVVARHSDHDFAIRGIIFDTDQEFYHVDWGQWGKKPVPINWVESLLPWRLIYRPGDTTP